MSVQTIVIKLGSSSLVDEETHEPKLSTMTMVVETIIKLRAHGHRVVIVSSGGIAMGLNELNCAEKPKELAKIQALAAVGQGKLIGIWNMLFTQYSMKTAQILLTRNDILNWNQYNNAKNTILELLEMGVVPIVNENDTLSINEIKFGDNDTLSAITAGLIQANHLFLLTDVDCLYTDNPKVNPEANPILYVPAELDDSVKSKYINISNNNTGATNLGTGGMQTKIFAADLAINSGINTFIMNSSRPRDICDIILGFDNLPQMDESLVEATQDDDTKFIDWQYSYIEYLKSNNLPRHTIFTASHKHFTRGKEFWLLHGLKSKGTVIIDQEAYEKQLSSCSSRVSVLSSESEQDDEDVIDEDDEAIAKVGIKPEDIIDVKNTFHKLDCVELRLGKRLRNGKLDKDAPLQFIGKARCNFTSIELQRIKGMDDEEEITDILGYRTPELLVAKKDDMVLV